MSDGTATVVGDVLRVLVVGDSSPVDAAMDALSSQFESISLVRERAISSAIERLTQLDIHCIVCPLETAGDDPSPLELLRDHDSELPIVVVTKGGPDGANAAETALEAGATDVIEADDPRSLIATRVKNAAERHRLETASGRPSRSILERSDALVWVLDESGTVVYASSAVEPRLGYTPDELERTPLTQLVHPDDRKTVGETLETVSTAAFGTTDRVTARIGHADGSWHVYELTATNRLEDPHVEGVVLTLSDAPAADSETTVRTALDRLADPFFTLGPQWEIQYANAAANRVFGSDVTVESGTVVWDLLDDAVRSQFYERFLEARATDDVVEFETTVPTLETRFAVSVHPGEDGATVYAREAPDADTAIDRERYALLESAVDALEDGLLVLEGSTIRFANAALFELTDETAVVGQEIDSVFDDDLAAAIRERAQSPVVRWMDPLSGELASDDRHAVDVFVTPLPGDDRTLCVVRDRYRSSAAALSTIRETITAIRTADTRPAIRQSVLDAALATTGADLAGWYLVETDVLRPATVETAASNPLVNLPAIDREGIDLVDRLESETDAGEGIVFDRSELETVLSRSGIRAERVLAVPVGDHGIVLATSTEPMAFGALDRTPLEVVAGTAAIALNALERGSTIRSHRADLDRLEAVVARCQQVRDIEQSLLTSETQTEITQQLCDALVSLEFAETPGTIDLAWIGDVATGSNRITPDAWAGRNGDFLESVSIRTDGAHDSAHPTVRAAETLEPTVVSDVGQGRTDQEWQRRALDRDFRSVLSIPLVADEFCYGMLTIYGAQPSTFDDATRPLCEHLAAVASYAIAAVERKRALLSEQITELEIVLRDGDEPLSVLAHNLDHQLDVQAVVPRSSGGSTVFCTVPTSSDELIQSAIDAVPEIESGRLIGDRADASVIELTLAESTVAATLANHGGVLRSITPIDGRSRLVIELSSTVDVRSFVRMVERTHPGANLVARRERDRSDRPARAFDAELRDRLSERQLRTLETAYYSGFFEWPRESTGEDVADSLGVSQPTFSRHLRIAQHKLFALLFDERDITGTGTS